MSLVPSYCGPSAIFLHCLLIIDVSLVSHTCGQIVMVVCGCEEAVGSLRGRGSHPVYTSPLVKSGYQRRARDGNDKGFKFST